MEATKKMSITINGKQYIVNHNESDEYVHKIGQYVNRKIAETSIGGMKLVEPTATVMACINITDELFKSRKQLQKAEDDIELLKKEKRELELRLSRLQGGR